MILEKVLEIIKECDNIFFSRQLKSDVKEKGKSDYVTGADIEISNYLHRRLLEEFPEVGFMSEEEKNENTKENFWILDPIDGTTNFIHDMRLSAVSLGYAEGDRVVAGVIYVPDTKDIYYAEKGKGAYLNGEQIFVSDRKNIATCLAALELNAYFKNESDKAFYHADKIFNSFSDVRVMGCAALSLAYVACGRLDAFLGRYLKPWDFAAGKIIVEEAGGRVESLNNKVDLKTLNQHITATNKYLYNEFCEILK